MLMDSRNRPPKTISKGPALVMGVYTQHRNNSLTPQILMLMKPFGHFSLGRIDITGLLTHTRARRQSQGLSTPCPSRSQDTKCQEARSHQIRP